VLHGESETGATLHEMVAKADAGRIVDQQSVPILPDDTARQVFDKVTVAAEMVLWRSLPSIVAGEIRWQANDLARGSYFGGRRPEDGRIDWTRPAAEVYNLVRAVAPPYPGAFTEVGGVRLVIAKARRAQSRDEGQATLATGLHILGSDIVGICGDGGRIIIHELLGDGRSVRPEALAALVAGRGNPTTP
jgi:methionyl-tRNA formyltransferase